MWVDTRAVHADNPGWRDMVFSGFHEWLGTFMIAVRRPCLAMHLQKPYPQKPRGGGTLPRYHGSGAAGCPHTQGCLGGDGEQGRAVWAHVGLATEHGRDEWRAHPVTDMRDGGWSATRLVSPQGAGASGAPPRSSAAMMARRTREDGVAPPSLPVRRPVHVFLHWWNDHYGEVCDRLRLTVWRFAMAAWAKAMDGKSLC